MNKLKKSKQIISLLLCMVMMIGILPKQVFAEDSENIESENFGLNNPTYENQVATFDCVWFGNYMQSGNDETTKEPIKWRVLSVDGNRALLLADKNLDNKRFNDWWNWGIPWESSTLREWMNSDFVDTAFGENEKSALCTKNDIQDKVFALSKSEIETMNNTLKENAFNDDAIKNVWRSTNTDYLNSCLEKEEIEAPNTGWWLRSNGMFNFLACRITENGELDERNINEGDEQGRTMARPSIYLDLTKTDSWSYAGTVSSDGKVNEVKKDTEEINENYFSGEKDGWPFANSYQGFGFDENHNISLNTYLSKLVTGRDMLLDGMLNPFITTVIWLTNNVGDWKGNCFGMSLSSAAIYTNKYDPSKIFPNTYEPGKTLNQYGYQNIESSSDGNYYTIAGNNEAINLIEGLQLIQSNLEFSMDYGVFRNDDNFKSLIEYLKNPSDNRIILLGLPGHAVIIDKSLPIIENESNIMIPLYDCNFPSDSNSLLGKDTKCIDYLVIWPEKNTYQTIPIEINLQDMNDYHIVDKYQSDVKPRTTCGLDNLKFYDVTNVDDRFLSMSILESTLKNSLYMSSKTFEITDSTVRYIEMLEGVLKSFNSSDVKMFTPYLEDTESRENDKYIIKLDNYNDKAISIEDGTFFVTSDNSMCGLSVEGKVTSKLEFDNNQMIIKSLKNHSKVNIIIHDGFNENYKAINVEVILDSDEELLIQNKDGILTIDSPADKKGNIQIDNAGKIEEKTDTLLKDLNGYNIGTGKQETTSDNTESDDKKDTKDDVIIDNNINSSSKGEDTISNNTNNKLSIVDKKETGAESRKGSPDTGDYQNLTLWVSLLVISMFTIGTCGYVLHFKRKKKR